MKKFILTIGALLVCNASSAQTETIKWYMDNTTYITSTCESGGDVSVPGQMPTKRGYEFIGWHVPKYTPLLYIENIANETYIDTGVYANNNTKIVATFLNVSVNGSCSIFGRMYGSERIIITSSWQDGKCYYCQIYFGSSSNYLYCGCKKSTMTVGKGVHTSSLDFRVPSLLVFASSPTNISKCVDRIYSLQVYQDDVLTHDYVPAKDPDGVVCLYDKVDDTFLYNAGTGEFIGGPVVDYD